VIRGSAAVKLRGAVDRRGSGRIGKDAGEVAGIGRIGVEITDDLKPFLGKKNLVVIDFSRVEASLGFLKSAAEKATPVVVGTTGFSAEHLREIKGLTRRTPILLSANMSLGVNLLLSLLGKVARTLGEDYDVEIVEAHHRYKKDAPSGTALALGRVITHALGRNLDEVGVAGRKGMVGERTKKEIGLLSVRAGDIVGDHTVIFGGLGERLEFTHRAHSRETFARGAVRAAAWLVKQKKGLYGMQDALGLDF
jgi:4-hydroxy-tetrahydrodipicolinate reductase